MKINCRNFLVFAVLMPCWFGIMLSTQGCGGGGGNDNESYSGSANLSLEVQPSQIETGDRMRVTVNITDIHPDGISLKVFFPDALVYVPSSASIKIDSIDSKLKPTINQKTVSGVYLVFYISYEELGKDGQGSLIFELEGIRKVQDGKIQVDADVDDPLISNDTEFNVKNPQFGAEDEANISIL